VQSKKVLWLGGCFAGLVKGVGSVGCYVKREKGSEAESESQSERLFGWLVVEA
jgi:hypothetical protein